jgi:hypothetical protein
MATQDTTMSDTATSTASNMGHQLMDKASSFFKGLQGNDTFNKVTGWVKANPRAAAGIGAVLGAFLVKRLRR